MSMTWVRSSMVRGPRGIHTPGRVELLHLTSNRRSRLRVPPSQRSGAGRQLAPGILHRRVKVRWVTPLGDETASRS